jgi:hypothetical protein
MSTNIDVFAPQKQSELSRIMSIIELSEIANALLDIGKPIEDIATQLDVHFEHVELNEKDLSYE